MKYHCVVMLLFMTLRYIDLYYFILGDMQDYTKDKKQYKVS